MSEANTLRRSPRSSAASLAAAVPHPVSQPDERASLGKVPPPEAQGSGRVVICYRRVTTQLIDFENFAGSTKAITDCLRAAFPEWIPDDSPEYVEIIHRQERCRCKDEEGTWVEIWREEVTHV